MLEWLRKLFERPPEPRYCVVAYRFWYGMKTECRCGSHCYEKCPWWPTKRKKDSRHE